MDEIQQLGDALIRAIAEQRAIRGRRNERDDDDLDDKVRDLCDKMLDVGCVPNAGGCPLCRG